MKRSGLLVLSILLLGSSRVLAGGEIFGKVTTTAGRTYRGPIRWDRNEVSWQNALDAQKEKRVRSPSRHTDLPPIGREIAELIRVGSWTHSRFSIPFGHLRAIEPLGSGRALLRLKNGEEFKVLENGTDLGDEMRGIEIQDGKAGRVKLKWDQVDRVEFEPDPRAGGDADMLYGTVETRRGEYTGFIVWDRDEALREDLLDGDAGGDRRSIPFREIREIRRRSSRSCDVVLARGETVTLSGTNDVNSDNRGIEISVAGLGTIEVGWNQLKRVLFADAPAAPRYQDFNGGRSIQGTVVTLGGESHRGNIVWDDDEERSWETLDGEEDGVEYSIPFENIQSIQKVSDRAAEVTLLGGKVFVLEGSNDVSWENKGIQVTESGRKVTVGWDDFDRLELGRPEPAPGRRSDR